MKIKRQSFLLKKERGITFAELIVVIAIIGIMTTVTLVSLSATRASNDLKAAARQVAASIREMQANALSGKVGAGSSSCQISWSDTGTSYQAGCLYYTTTNPNPSFSLPNGVKFVGGGFFAFKVPFGNKSTDSSTSVQMTKSGTSIYVCVDSSGAVTEKSSCP